MQFYIMPIVSARCAKAMRRLVFDPRGVLWIRFRRRVYFWRWQIGI